jgi:hypothetical protein
MSFSKATSKPVPIGTSVSNTHHAFGRDRSYTDHQLPPSFDSATAFMRKRAESKRDDETYDYGGKEYDELYSPEVIVADPSVVDTLDDLSVFDVPPSPPPLTRQNAVCFVCCKVPGSYKTNGLCEDCYHHPLCLHCGMKCDNKDVFLCKEHSHLTMTDLYYGTCGPCKTDECLENGYTQLCGYCWNCAAYEHNHLPWTPILSVDAKDQAQAPDYFCKTCGSDLYLGYCSDVKCQNTCPECLEDNDGYGNQLLCNACYGYNPEEDMYTNEYEASMIPDDCCQICGFGIDTPCHWCRQE